MRILLTGINGLLGRQLPAIFSSDQIIALVRKTPELTIKNVDYLQCDLSQPLIINTLPTQIDAVIHLAQSSNYRNFPDQALDVFQINTACTAGLLDYARRAGAKSFFYASSGSVYEPYDRPMLEDERISPTSYYAISKYSAERLLLPYQSYFKTCAFRLFFLYGSGQSTSLIPNLIQKIRAKQMITLDQPHGLVFTPTHVRDIAKLIKLSIDNAWNGILNVANPESVNMRDLTTQIGIYLNQVPCYQAAEKVAPIVVPLLKRLHKYYPEMNFINWKQGVQELCQNEVLNVV